MKQKYTIMTKAELIKKISELEKGKSKISKENFVSEIDELNHELHLKEMQIENQKFELLDKQIQLEASRDKYADLYDFAPTGYATLNSSGIIEEINLTGAAMLGVETRHTQGIPFINFLIKEDMQRFMDFLKKCKSSGSNLIEEFTLNGNKNRFMIVQLTVLSYQDYRTKKISFRVSISDITASKKAEKAMHESEERFRLMADASPVMIWMTDSKNEFAYLNRTILDFLGKKQDEVKSSDLVENIHLEDLPLVEEVFSKAVEDVSDIVVEFRLRNKQNEYRWILNTAASRILIDGTFIGFIGSGVDITESKNSRIKLEKSLKEKEILLKEIHHRVKNNLQVMSSLLSLQKNYIHGEEVMSIFNSSQSRIAAMALLHEHLYGSNNLSNINFKDYVNSISQSLLETYRGTINNIRINLEIEDIQLNLDTSINFGLIINELVSNSLKHAFSGKENGLINISLNKKGSKSLMLIVSDNGIGLPDDFDLRKGNTLGFELVSNIVAQLQGKLEVAKNGKSEFKIYVSENDIVSFS